MRWRMIDKSSWYNIIIIVNSWLTSLKIHEEMHSVCTIQVAMTYIVYHVNTLDCCDSACRCGNPKRHASKHNSSWTDSLMIL